MSEHDTKAEKNPITEAMKTALKVAWKPGQTEEEFVALHYELVAKEKRPYTSADRLAAAHVQRAMSEGTAGTASIKELIDRTEGPVNRKQEEKKAQSYVVALPLPPEGLDGRSPRERWEGILASQGVVLPSELPKK